jgi:hypothetical protein
MCSTCGCKDAETFHAPIRPDDELCVACGKDELAMKSNLCKACQEGMGIKKISARRLAQLGWTAEGDEMNAETTIAQEYSETIDEIEDLEQQVKKTVAPKRKPTKYLREAKGSVMDSWKQMRKDGFRKEMYDKYIKDAESLPVQNVEDGISEEIFGDVGEGNNFGQMRAESFEAEWDFGNDREALRNNDEFNAYWEWIFKSKRRAWPSWGQKFYDKYKWTLDDSTWNPYVMGGVLEDEEEPKGFRDAESFEAESKFDKLANKIAAEYRKKGKSAKEAMKIGKATAYKIGARKYGKAGMARKARAGMRAEEFHAEGKGGLPWMTFAFIGLGAFVASRIKTIGFKADGDCGCGCSGESDCGDKKEADEGHYPNTYDPVQDFLPRYRYPEDSDWSNSYNPADPYRPLDYQTVQTDSRTTADRM